MAGHGDGEKIIVERRGFADVELQFNVSGVAGSFLLVDDPFTSERRVELGVVGDVVAVSQQHRIYAAKIP